MSGIAGPSTNLRHQRSPRTLGGQDATTSDPENTVTKTYRRSRDGCYTCRLRRKKCDETHPKCAACTSLGVSCEYRKPSWWISTQARNLQKEKIKQRVRETKVMQKEVALQEYIRHAVPSAAARETPVSNPQVETTTYDPTTSYLPTPTTAPLMNNPYDFNAGFGASAFVQDPISSSFQDSTSIFSAMATPLIPMLTPTTTTTMTTTTTTPALQTGEWYQGFTDPLPRVPNTVVLGSSEFPTRPLSFYLEGTMARNDRERSLLFHFVDNVLKLVFPILDLHKQGPSRAREILRSLDSNKSYYHCCLSVSAIHLKTVKKHRGKRVADDIMRHRYAAIAELSKALYADNGHDTILDATLAMIFFRCSVGSPENDGLLDIPWTEHFTAVTNLVNKLGLIEANPFMVTPFSMSLSSWVDILGSTMLGKSPQFAHIYRNKHLNGISSGLRELMGCDDRIMYLISEIACLDSLKGEGRIDDFTISHHVTALAAQLDHAEASVIDPTLENPISATGIIQADKLTKNMTAIFRVAARIYLYSLMPGFHHDQQSTMYLVETVANLLQYIPSGPLGFDRPLVWPMLVTGAFSTPASNFRAILARRIAALGVCNDFGSFGRMYTVLQELWKLSDEPDEPTYADPILLPSTFTSSSVLGLEPMAIPPASIQSTGRRIKKQPLHWRDVMRAHEWQYLLL